MLNSVALRDGRVFAIGGEASSALSPLNEVLMPDATEWSARAPLPEPGSGSAAVVGSDGRVYVVGPRALQAYRPDDDAWDECPPLPTERRGLAATVAGSRIYTFGGTPAGSGVTLSLTEIYDVESAKWVAGPDSPTPVAWAAACTLRDGRLLLVGGFDGRDYVREVRVFDPRLEEWADGPPLRRGRANFALAAFDGFIFAVGGESRPGPLAAVEMLDQGAVT
jgi:hypothetical protein